MTVFGVFLSCVLLFVERESKADASGMVDWSCVDSDFDFC
jgi:hypothetical protein